MPRGCLVRVLPLVGLLMASQPALGAEVDRPLPLRRAAPAVSVGTTVFPTCRAIWTCSYYGCSWRHVCPRRCPDRYSCYSLFGAYGPYGGAGYWGRYTWSGWGAYRY